MKKQAAIALTLIGSVFLMGIVIPALLSKGDKANPGGFTLPGQSLEITITPYLPINQIIPTQTPTLDFSQSRNCTYTYYFWVDHPENWPDQAQIAGYTITKAQALQLMQSPDRDITTNLQRSLYVALLNIQAGADRGTIDKTLTDAANWLVNDPEGVPLSQFNQSIAVTFTQVLDDYNNGEVGPGLCPNQPATPTPIASVEFSVQQPIDTLVPTATRRVFRPTFTPTDPPPSPPPTDTPVPPTYTPVPPTSTPLLPTRTPIPPSPTISTPTFTPIPPSPTLPSPTPTPTQAPATPTPVPLPLPTLSTATKVP